MVGLGPPSHARLGAPLPGRDALIVTVLALGFGLAGVLEVALIHQTFQWHHFVLEGDASAQVRSDGILLAGLWAITLAATLSLWRLARFGTAPFDDRRILWGGLLAGAGAFNVLDVLIDHVLLDLHRLFAGDTSWLPDVAWLAGSALVLLAGLALLVRAHRAHANARAGTRRRIMRPSGP